jgi:hypothetical protein
MVTCGFILRRPIAMLVKLNQNATLHNIRSRHPEAEQCRPEKFVVVHAVHANLQGLTTSRRRQPG